MNSTDTHDNNHSDLNNDGSDDNVYLDLNDIENQSILFEYWQSWSWLIRFKQYSRLWSFRLKKKANKK